MKKYVVGTDIFFTIALVIFLCNAGCRPEGKNPPDTLTSGTINISVDESFKPVIDEQIRVFEKSYPNAHIIPHYKSEADCLKDLFFDSSNRMVIVTRGLSDAEDKIFKDSLHYLPHWDEIARDAIAIVVNNQSVDTVFSIDRLKQQLTGKIKRNQKIVFDGLNATSTVRFIMDSILKGEKFDTSVVKAVKTSKDVLTFVSENASAIGFVGISWIGNPEDRGQLKLLNKVKIAYVSCKTCGDTPFVKPMQVSILTQRYPLIRGLYYILKENYNGLGTGFVNFMKYERGQLIFKRAYLGSQMGFGIRNVKINE